MTADNTSIVFSVPHADDMRRLGRSIGRAMKAGDVLVLSGPLGAGKTTLTQGIGQGLHIDEPMVSPTFTIARELAGRYQDGSPARVIHMDAYRLPGSDNDDLLIGRGGQSEADRQKSRNRLLDELESLGLDEELEDPGPGTSIVIEWGSLMASALSDDRLEISISRPAYAAYSDRGELTSDGERTVTIRAVGTSWKERQGEINL